MLNEHHDYHCARAAQSGLDVLYIETELIEPVHSLLASELGVRSLPIARCDDVVAEARRALADDCPVMLTIDRYYEPCCPEYYQRVHHLHNVLLLGFDESQQRFRLFDDHVDGRGPAIERCELTYVDLERAYVSCWHLWRRELAQLDSFVAYQREASPADLDGAVARARRRFLATAVARSERAASSSAVLARFAASFGHEMTTDSTLALYQTMFRRVAELAVTRSNQAQLALGEQYSVLEPHAVALVRAWQRIGATLLKARLSSRAASSFLLDTIAPLLLSGVELERRYAAEYAALCERSNQQ